MVNYKLTYFNVTALGEHIRYLFAYGDIKYEDNRVNSDTFQAMKPNLPFGQLPLLEIDSKKVTQSMAIGRYLARIVGLYGEDEFETLQIDEAIDQVNDFKAKVAAAGYEPDAKIRAEKIAKVKKNEAPYFLERFNKFAANNGYLVNGKLSLADLIFAGMLSWLNYRIGFNLIENYPNLQKLVQNVENEPKIKKYIETRPITEF